MGRRRIELVWLGVVAATLGAAACSADVSAPPADFCGSEVLQLEVGQVADFLDDAGRLCVRLAAAGEGAAYLLVPQDARRVEGPPVPFRLVGSAETPTPLTSRLPARRAGALLGQEDLGPAAAEWEARLRQREAKLLRQREQELGRIRPSSVAAPAASPGPPPKVGDEREFLVLTREDTVTRVRAVVRAVSEHAVVYQDVQAGSDGFTDAEIALLASIFDDPVYTADVAAFGNPSDLDGNARIIILLTPAVNLLTRPEEKGFIIGFVRLCDLLSSTFCPETNRGEIMYLLVPDPDGQYGKRHESADLLQRALPPALAHELQHLISFNYRPLPWGGLAADELWLSEALAHAAEELVGQVVEARGDSVAAARFRAQNYRRAQLFLENPAQSSLISPEGVGTLEQRGAAWLFVEYLAGRFNRSVLASLTRYTGSGVDNVVTQTHTPWNSLVNDWAVALYADDAPELRGSGVDVRYTFAALDLRRIMAPLSPGGVYPLRPEIQGFSDFSAPGAFAATSAWYFRLEQGEARTTLRVRLTAETGSGFPRSARPQLAVLRLR